MHVRSVVMCNLRLIRELITRVLGEQKLRRRIGQLDGRLDLPTPSSGWQRQIKERNWRD